MHLLDLVRALVQHAVDGRGDGQGAADDGAEADKETGEGLCALFAVDDFHGGDVLGWLVYLLSVYLRMHREEAKKES